MSVIGAASVDVSEFASKNSALIKQQWLKVSPALEAHPDGRRLLAFLENASNFELHLDSITQALAQFELLPDVIEFIDTLQLSINLSGTSEPKPESVKETPIDTLWLIPTFVEDARMVNRKASLLAFKKKVEGTYLMMGRPSPAEVEERTTAKLRMPTNALFTGGYTALSSSTSTDRATKLEEARKAMFEKKTFSNTSSVPALSAFDPSTPTAFSFPTMPHAVSQAATPSFSSENASIVVPTGTSTHFQRYEEKKKAKKAMPANQSFGRGKLADEDDGSEEDQPKKKKPVKADKKPKETKTKPAKLPKRGKKSADSSDEGPMAKKKSPAKKFEGPYKFGTKAVKSSKMATPDPETEPPLDPNSFYPSLLVVTLTGKHYTLENRLKPSDTVQKLKDTLREMSGIPIEAQRLIFQGKETKDDLTLSTYRVSKLHNRFHLVLRLSTTPSVHSAVSSSSAVASSSTSDSAVSVSAIAKPTSIPGWSKIGTVYVRGAEFNLPGATKVAAFDMDQTLIQVKSGAKFPKDEKDWKWLCPEVVPKIQKLMADGYRIVILTNQNGIEKGLQNGDHIMKKINALAKELGAACGSPVLAMAATGKDKYRKPSPMLWQLFIQHLNKDVVPGPDSFFVGDAAGRKKDHSCADRSFAANAGLRFFTENVFFYGDEETPLPPIVEHETVKALKSAAKEGRIETYKIEPSQVPVEMVLMCGLPGSGKSTIYKSFFQPRGYEHVNLDTEKSASKCLSLASSHLSAHKSIVVDQTFPSKKSREAYIELAKKYKVPVRVIVTSTPLPVAKHFNTIRSWLFDIPHVPDVGYNMFLKSYEAPAISEGFAEVLSLPFRLTVDDPKLLAAIQWITNA